MGRTTDQDLSRRLATRAVHAGQEPDPLAGAVMTPIYQTSTYVQEGIGRHKGYEYARTRNPTREAAERNVAALEGARFGYAFASRITSYNVCYTKLLRVIFFWIDEPTPRSPLLYDTGIVILGQGHTVGYLGGRRFHYDADTCLVLGVPVPFA